MRHRAEPAALSPNLSLAGYLHPREHVIPTVRPIIVLVLAASLTVACSDSSSTPTSPSSSSSSGSPALTASQIAGTWTLVSLQPDGQPLQVAPAGYALTLADGRLSARADCNSCSASYTLTGQLLTTSPQFACTRAACATMAFESAYTSALAGQSTVSLAGDTLVLTSARGVLRFSR
jgi:heat shock protein HslJ